MLKRMALPVKEDKGFYDPGSDPLPLKELYRQVEWVRVRDELKGWSPYTWSIETDQGWFFVTGGKPPTKGAPA